MEIKEQINKLTEHVTHEVMQEMLSDTLMRLNSVNPHLATDLLETFDGNLNYNNFLTEAESQRILAEFLNEDGSHGAIWPARDFFAKAESLGYVLDNPPYYNRWAFYVTASHFISDQLSVIEKWTGKDVTKYAECACDLAIAQLKDRDKTKWIRWYFRIS